MSEINIITIGSNNTTDYDYICEHLDALLSNVKDKRITISVPRSGCPAEPLFLLYASERRYDWHSIELKTTSIHEWMTDISSSESMKDTMMGFVGFGNSEEVQKAYQTASNLKFNTRKINDKQ